MTNLIAQGELQDRINAGVGTVLVNPDSLESALEGVSKIVTLAAAKVAATKLKLETITVELGISASGQVGFLGTGVQVGASASISLEIRVVQAT
jgi:hypothetical protein